MMDVSSNREFSVVLSSLAINCHHQRHHQRLEVLKENLILVSFVLRESLLIDVGKASSSEVKAERAFIASLEECGGGQ